ncbi:T9SS type A sorting domain-containing protein [Flavobacterium covae]|uniref:T9SS type A sorting domain-containing protein n=1 Tax=Flavobacterium covae TaxID=2906076 RepID=UPI001FB7F91C|nr:T9SS type A sorting domain-containing protein [Flavobacterium covae]MCJ1807421.1 T9SS type A sorting domain-containing protein [Flavobacterium covae]
MRKYLYLLMFFTLIGNAQNPGQIAQKFGSINGFDGTVSTITVQPDGKILVAGTFHKYSGQLVKKIVRLNGNGTIDPSFSTTILLDDDITCIAVQPDRKILIGGHFTTYNGVNQNKIIRLNSNGTKDNSFIIGSGFDASVTKILVQPNGKIIVGGNFNTYNGTTQNKIARLNSNGSSDTSFVTNTGFDNLVTDMALQADGKILVTGLFSTYKGQTVNNFIRINANGTKDNSFNNGSGFDSTINSIAIQTNGKIIIGGNFKNFNGISQKYLIRLNNDGSKDGTFDTDVVFDGAIRSLAIQNDGKIVIAVIGKPYVHVGPLETNIIRLNPDGKKDLDFSTGSCKRSLICLSLLPCGKIIAGGYFTIYGQGYSANNIVSINTNGTFDLNFNPNIGFDKTILTAVEQKDRKIVLGGHFTRYKNNLSNYIIRLNPNGSKDRSFNVGNGFDKNVSVIVVQPDRKLIVAGSFSTYKGVTENHIIRLNPDGTKDVTFNTGTGFDGNINVILLQPDGKIFLGGEFTKYNEVTANRIIKLNSNGSIDTSFNTGTGFDGDVLTMALEPNGNLIVGGEFSSYNDEAEKNIIRLKADGVKDTLFNIGTGFDSAVNNITLQADSKILVSGYFSNFNNSSANYFVRLNTNGTIDTTFNIGTGFNSSPSVMLMQTDGKIIVGGSFTSFNENQENYIIRLNSNGTKDSTFITENGFNNSVLSITPISNGKILVSGNFNNYKNSINTAYLVSLYNNSSSPKISVAKEEESNNFKLSRTTNISIFPNPTSNILNINLNNDSSISSIQILNLEGKVVHEDINETINVSELPSGLYIIKIKTDKEEIIKKFIKE